MIDYSILVVKNGEVDAFLTTASIASVILKALMFIE
jgi:hypothetical protein